MSTSIDLDALIVGAGPVGLLAAVELASRGCRVRIIDALDKIEIKTKASGIHARSMEVLPKPVVGNIMRHGNFLEHMRINETDPSGNSTPIANISLESVPIYKGIWTQTQWRTEEMVNEYLETLPDLYRGAGQKMRVERGREFLDIVDHAEDRVVCQIRDKATGSTEAIAAKFLIGADGGRSSIRKNLEVSFEGEATHEYWFALHAGLDNYVGDFETSDVFFSRGEDPLATGFAFTMPMQDGGYLITADLDEDQQEEWLTGEQDKYGWPVLRQPEPQDIIKILRQRGCGKSLALREGTVKWVAHFRVQSRQAGSYREGRVFIAGDACHCHSPLGGQGMNMGFQDAKNLAWKLALAVKNPGPSVERLLDSYQQERRGVDKNLTAAIEKATSMASNRNPVVFFLRGRGQRLVGHLTSIGAGGKFMSQQAWSYNPSILSQEHWERPPVTCCPITTLCPCGGYRRRQNIFRWAGRRTRCGDRAPAEAICDSGESLEQVMKRSRGWTLVLFEGLEEDNEDQEKHLRDAETMSAQELCELGDSMKVAPDASGFVNGVDEVVVFSADGTGNGHDMFGVRGQCMYVIRPDMHVGLRCEPVREGAVYRYFKKTCGMSKQPSVSCPSPSYTFDWLPTVIWLGIFLIVLVSFIFVDEKHPNKFALRIVLGIVCLIVLVLAILQFLGTRWAASATPPDEDEEGLESGEENDDTARELILSPKSLSRRDY